MVSELAIREAYRHIPCGQNSSSRHGKPYPLYRLAGKVVYTLSGRTPGISLTDLCQFRTIIAANKAAPTWKIQAGEVDSLRDWHVHPRLERLMSLLGPMSKELPWRAPESN